MKHAPMLMSKQMRDCFRHLWFDRCASTDSRAKRSDKFPRSRILSESLSLYEWSFQRHRSSFAHELPLRSDVKQSADNFFGRFRRYPLHGWQRSATCPVEATVRGGRRWLGGKREGPRWEGLYGRGARLKFLHTKEWKPKNRAKEERARRKNREGGGRGKSCRRLRGERTDGCLAVRWSTDVIGGLSNLQLVARHVRIITQHASFAFSLFFSLKDIYIRELRRASSLAQYLGRSDVMEKLLYGPIRNVVPCGATKR